MDRAAGAQIATQFVHEMLPCGAEFAADVLPQRDTVAMCFRVLTGVADEPEELIGIGSIVEQTLSKGTAKYDGRGLADAFDALGAQWGTASGRQSALIRVLCLPEFAEDVVELVAEMLCRPTFPDEACEVAVRLGLEQLKHLEDEPSDLLRVMIQRLTLGPVYGRNPHGEPETLPRITPQLVREHWKRGYCVGRLQVAVAGRVDPQRLARRIEQHFRGFGDGRPAGRDVADFAFKPARLHRDKALKQQYIAMTLPGMPKGHADFAAEQVLIGVLSGGMSGRLFVEVREKQGLVYWVGAWHEQPRGRGVIHIGASTTPERCEKTYRTLLREIRRVGRDLSEEEVERARSSLIAHAQTEDDLTRARASLLSDDLFHFGRPLGLEPKLAALRRVRVEDVVRYARGLRADELCVATLGPRALGE